MDKIDTQVQRLNPVRVVDVEVITSSPVVSELAELITQSAVTTPSDLVVASPPPTHSTSRLGSAARRRHRGRRRTGVAALAAACSMAAVIAVSSHTTTPATHATAPHWRLVSDVTSSWQVASGFGSAATVYLDCPSATTCYAVNLQPTAGSSFGEIEVTHDGGATWESALPESLADATPLSCVDASTCATLGIGPSGAPEFLQTTNGGVSWTTTAGPSQFTSTIGLAAMICTSAKSCVAVASDSLDSSSPSLSFATSDGGTTWDVTTLPSEFIPRGERGMQCPSVGHCVVDGIIHKGDRSQIPSATVIYTDDDGATWSAASTPPGVGPLGSVSCGSTTDCVASFFGGGRDASSIVTSSDGGQTWTAAAASGLPAADLTSVSCPTASICFATGMTQVMSATHTSAPNAITFGSGSTGIVAATTDSGASWTTEPLPHGVTIVYDISCPSTSSCFALGMQTGAGEAPPTFVLLASD